MSNKKQIWLLRHAETEWSVNGRHTGRTDIPLTPAGEERAKVLQKRLADKSFGLVLVSPLDRAKQTCRLAGLLDQAEEEPNLMEWDYGDYEGVKTVDIRKDVPGWTIWSAPVPNGETPEDVAARARHVIDRAMAADGDVALFSHGHFLRVLAATYLELPPQDGRFFELTTGTMCILGFEHEYRTIKLWNQAADLVPQGD
ncbi:MAG: histidine phosphatase family protein [Phycisphaerae bacterium]|nr:histidine phosphatase family protein [Phycisphaerae bacterium]